MRDGRRISRARDSVRQQLRHVARGGRAGADRGRDVLLEIDWQGAQQIRRSFPTAVSLFILPPSHHALSERLRRRGEDNDEAIGKRTAEAVIEMSHHDEYDYLIVNDRFDDAVADLRAIIRAERLRTSAAGQAPRALLADLLSHGKPIQ